MSLPTSASKPTQLSIRSFFQAQSPSHDSNGATRHPSPPPPPPPPPHTQSSTTSLPPTAPSPTTAADRPSNLNIPREATIRTIRPADIAPLRRLNALLLPVTYHDPFYQRAADPVAGRFSRLITWSHRRHGKQQQEKQEEEEEQPVIVGGIVCRVEPESPGGNTSPKAPAIAAPGSQVLYIQSLCLLSPYRSMGLVAAALDAIVDAAITDPDVRIDAVTAHVWTENEEGLHWYQARGFTHDANPIKGYYLKLRPDTAWLVSRPVPRANVRAALPPSSCDPKSQPQPLARQGISGTTAAVMNLPPPPSSRPPMQNSVKSFQNQRPETEWNDLPDDMTPPLLAPPSRRNDSEPGSSAASSRSSSSARKKKDRSYPVAAFGTS